MKKSMSLASAFDKILPASLVPIGNVLPRFMPCMVDLTLDIFDAMLAMAVVYAAEVGSGAMSRMYSLPTMICDFISYFWVEVQQETHAFDVVDAVRFESILNGYKLLSLRSLVRVDVWLFVSNSGGCAMREYRQIAGQIVMLTLVS